MSWGELDAAADRLAEGLRRQGLRPEPCERLVRTVAGLDSCKAAHEAEARALLTELARLEPYPLVARGCGGPPGRPARGGIESELALLSGDRP